MEPNYDKVSFGASRLVTHHYSTSFSIGVRCLASQIRDAVYGIYGFVRIADEIVDTFPVRDREALLDEFEAEYDRTLERGIGTNPVIHAFCRIVRDYGIDDSLVRAFLRSMRMDLYRSRYTTEQLGEYIYGSAEAVGLMCLTVFVGGDREQYLRLEPYARRLGAAFQKVNFLRDWKCDSEQLHRVYFPNLKGGTLTDAAKREILDDIREDFRVARIGIRQLPACARLGVHTACLYYRALTERIAETPCERLLDGRVRISNLHKALLFGRACITLKTLRSW